MASLKGLLPTTCSLLNFLISFPKMLMRGPLDGFRACSWSPFPGHISKVEVAGFPWPAVTSTSALLAPLGPCKEAYMN